MPNRIQRKRAAGWRAPLDTRGRKPVYVGRGSRYGNPFRIVREHGLWIIRVDPADGVRGERVGDYAFELQARKVAVAEFRAMFQTPGGAEQAEHFARMLHGRDLMCWCKTTDPCHADVLLELAGTLTTDTGEVSP